MAIRSTAKAIVIRNGSILLVKCSDQFDGEYYELPGGGQNPYETLHDAVKRECREETGYSVTPVRLAALVELIFLREDLRQAYPDYTHRLLQFFLCDLMDDTVNVPTETDPSQVGVEWRDITELSGIKLLPGVLETRIHDVLSGDAPIYLGVEYID